MEKETHEKNKENSELIFAVLINRTCLCEQGYKVKNSDLLPPRVKLGVNWGKG